MLLTFKILKINELFIQNCQINLKKHSRDPIKITIKNSLKGSLTPPLIGK